MRDLGRLQNALQFNMPRPSFFRSPRPDGPQASPASSSSSQFGELHNNVRSMVNGSSVYSDSPAPSNNNTPKIPFLGFLRRPQSPPDPIAVPNDAPRDSTDSRSPLRPNHTAGTYQRILEPLEPTPRQPEVVYARHPADVPLDYGGSGNSDTQQLQEEGQGRRSRRHHGRRKRHATHWTRRRSQRGESSSFIKSRAAKGKCFACLISGLFLITVLTICTLACAASLARFWSH